MSFADKLKEIAAKQKFKVTQHKLAVATGIPLGTIQRIWQGRTEPTWDHVQRIARALEVSTDEFRSDLDTDTAEPT